MMQYEKDLIYTILPNLTKAVDRLANELKRYNDNREQEQSESNEAPDEDEDWKGK